MPRPSLTRDHIVATALDLLDEVGLDGLSTRALADRLGVKSPALYWHFASKQELVTAMAETMTLELPDHLGLSLTGRRPSRAAVAAEMVERASAFRGVLLSRRDGARVHAGSRPPDSRLGVVEAQVALLCRIGIDPLDAARATLAISRFVVGWVLEEQSEHAVEVPALDPASYPFLAEATKSWPASDPDADFGACATAVVQGLLQQPRRAAS